MSEYKEKFDYLNHKTEFRKETDNSRFSASIATQRR